MKNSKIAMLILVILAVLSLGVVGAIADPIGNPAHGDDWGGACPGEGNWGSGQPPMGPTSATSTVVQFVLMMNSIL
ncbi:MAG: hypothetical protein KOO60_00480 [Gemmatimonadales bacterium]|nr:hypothetical protein [Gemmatimonadales bacterium]